MSLRADFSALFGCLDVRVSIILFLFFRSLAVLPFASRPRSEARAFLLMTFLGSVSSVVQRFPQCSLRA